MSKILYASDLHGNKVLFERLFELAQKHKVDAIFYGGDSCPLETSGLQQRIENQKKFLETYLLPKAVQLKKSNISFYCIMGNGDFRINEPMLIGADKAGKLHYIHNKAAKLGNFSIVGYNFVNLFPFAVKDWEKSDIQYVKRDGIRTSPEERTTIEQDLKQLSKLSDPKTTIYLFHGPPFDTKLDMMHNEAHIGSKAIRQSIEEKQPFMSFHGHVHESCEVSGSYVYKIGKSLCFNPGANPFIDKAKFILADLDDPKKTKCIDA